MSPRLSVLPSAPPALVLGLAALGQLKEQFAILALAGGAVLVVWVAGLGVALIVQLARGRSFVPWLVGLAVSALAGAGVAALVVDAPLWVQWRAAPALEAIERTRIETGNYPGVASLDGDFPTSLRATLDASGHCLYKPRAGSYHLICLGISYLPRCGYDGSTKRWSGLE